MMRRLASVMTALAAVLVLSAPVAARAFPFHGEYGGSGPDVLCGLDVVNVNQGTYSGRSFVDGSGAQVRFDIKNSGTDTYTYAATGLSVTWAYELLFKNFNGVDNGDGTISGDQTTVGKSTWYGPSGAKLFIENGPITVHLEIDFNVDPPLFQSTVLSQHGHHPDVCQAVRTALGA